MFGEAQVFLVAETRGQGPLPADRSAREIIVQNRTTGECSKKLTGDFVALAAGVRDFVVGSMHDGLDLAKASVFDQEPKAVFIGFFAETTLRKLMAQCGVSVADKDDPGDKAMPAALWLHPRAYWDVEGLFGDLWQGSIRPTLAKEDWKAGRDAGEDMKLLIEIVHRFAFCPE